MARLVAPYGLPNQAMKDVPFFSSVRAKFLAVSFVLLLIPLVGFLFVRELVGYLRTGQEQVAVAAVRLVAASLSDRPEINLHTSTLPGPPNGLDATIMERERIVALFSASDPATVSSLGDTYQPDKLVERILNQSGVRDGRIWVIDAGGRVRGLMGSLGGMQKIEAATLPSAKNNRTWLSSFPAISTLAPPLTATGTSRRQPNNSTPPWPHRI
ncbi:MAG: hypothetical protein WCL29_07060 [Pseudomonadota bacterium]